MIIINVILGILIWNCLFGVQNGLHCGLVGFSSAKGANIDKLKFLLFMNQKRGEDSLGHYSIDTTDKESKGSIQKFKGKPEDVLVHKEFNIPVCNLFIGHVRQATIGGVSANNAHPFKHGNIVLAMNGTISNHWQLGREYKVDTTNIFVDSEVLCGILNASQSKKPLTEIIGGCAVIYTDTNTNTLYVYRNADRPLYRGMIDNSMYISSIESSLKTIDCDKIQEFKQDTLYEIFEGKVVKTYNVKRAEEPVVQDVKNNTALSVIDRNSNNMVVNSAGDLIFNVGSFVNIKIEQMIGQFVTPVQNWITWESSVRLDVDKYYEVLSVPKDSNLYVNVVDETGMIVKVNKHAFEPHFLLTSIDGFCELKFDIYRTSGKGEQVAEKGDLALITKIYHRSEQVALTNMVNGKKFYVHQDLIRPLSNLETAVLRGERMSSNNFPEHPFKEEADPKNIIKAEGLEEDNSKLKIEDFGSVRQLAEYTLENIINLADELKEHVYNDVAKGKIKEIEEYINNYINTVEKIKELEDAN